MKYGIKQNFVTFVVYNLEIRWHHNLKSAEI